MIKKLSLFFSFLIFIQITLNAQKLSQDEVKSFTEECDDLVAYLQFTLNSIGDNDLSPKEKDIIISDSYSKLFRDAKVQIEDDLVPDREAITNKDIQAYLKDVDFFFQKVVFSYKILSVKLLQDEKNKAYFKIQSLRTLSGTNIKGDSIYNEQVRYIEVAIDANLRELKIVSIYTTKLNETEENIKWWNSLSYNWKEILGKETLVCGGIKFSDILEIQKDLVIISPPKDSIAYDEIELEYCDSLGMNFSDHQNDTLFLNGGQIAEKNKAHIEKALQTILNTKKLDLSRRLDISNLEPLGKLSSLNSLNISYTLVDDLYPIRNLIDLKHLNVSNTQIQHLDALVYSMSLQNLDLSYTKVYSLDPIRNLAQLKVLHFSHTHIDDLSSLSGLNKLSDIKMESTMVNDLQALSELQAIHFLDIDNSPISEIQALSHLTELRIFSCNNTMITSLESLGKLENLSVISCDNTEITSLNALNNMPQLSKIYCDNTLLGKEKALDFMSKNPSVLVVYESRTLKKWYESLNSEWKNIFNTKIQLDSISPTKEQLHQMASMPEIDISYKTNIKSIEALSQLKNLQTIIAHHTPITSMEPLYSLRELQNVDISNTPISSIGALENTNTLKQLNISFTNIDRLDALYQSHSLRSLKMESTNIQDISPLLPLSGMMELYADNSPINVQQIEEFIIENPKCVVLYQSEELQQWWSTLPDAWKDYFSSIESWTKAPNNKQLHQLIKRRKLTIDNNRDIKSLKPLEKFTLLKELTINACQIIDTEPIGQLHRLEYIDLSQNPITDISVLGGLENLQSITIANTPITNMDWALSLNKLQYLDINGSQIKNLNALSHLNTLETLMAYNTRISNLKAIDGLNSLRSLKIYNTKVSLRKVDKFKETNPSCVVDYY